MTDFHVGEVEIDQAFLDDQVGDAADAGIEHAVGDDEGIGEGGLGIGDAEEVLVRDDDDGIGRFAQPLDALVGRLHAALALEGEGLGDDADGQDAGLARRLGDDRGSARAGAAAHAGGDEAHMRAGADDP